MADRFLSVLLSLLFGPELFDKFRAGDAGIYARIKAEDEVVIYNVQRQDHPQA